MAVTNVFTDIISYNYSGNGKVVSSRAGTYTGTFDAGIACVIPAGSVNLLKTIVFPFATIQSMILEGLQPLTTKTNSSSAPANTILTTQTIAMIWAVDFVHVNPLTANVTAFYISNATALDSVYNFRALYN